TGNAVRGRPTPQIRSCPRNCQRRARATEPLGHPGKAVRGDDPRARRPAVATIVGPGGVPRARSGGNIAPLAELDLRAGQTGGSSTDENLATVYVCSTCRRAEDPDVEPRPGALLADATARAAQGSGVAVRRVRCLANCTRGPSAAVRANGGSHSWTYIFGGLDLAAAPALIDGARLLARAADGIMPWRGPPQPPQRGLIARLPPPHFA